MPLVVADTSPVFYLLASGHIDLLPRLFGKVVIPDAVQKRAETPDSAAGFAGMDRGFSCIAGVMPVQAAVGDAKLESLGAGEREARTLALSIEAICFSSTSARARQSLFRMVWM